MKTITIRKGIPKPALAVLDAAIERAYGFLCARYGYQFDDVELVITTDATRGRYCPKDLYRKVALAKIPMRSEWGTYDLKSLGVSADWLKVGYELGTAVVIIHELTHHVQRRNGRRGGELETTKNELDFIMQADPAWCKFLKKVN